MHRILKVAGVLAAGAMLAACSDAAATTDDGDDADVREVVGVDYGFEGLDDPIAAGTTLTFRNGSDAEFHELGIVRIHDDETRSLDELLAMPEGELMPLLDFVGVAAAMPGEVGEVVDGTLTPTEPGRYIASCWVPSGADPEMMRDMFADGGGGEVDPDAEDVAPPDMGEGAPHAEVGMLMEFTVE